MLQNYNVSNGTKLPAKITYCKYQRADVNPTGDPTVRVFIDGFSAGTMSPGESFEIPYAIGELRFETIDPALQAIFRAGIVRVLSTVQTIDGQVTVSDTQNANLLESRYHNISVRQNVTAGQKFGFVVYAPLFGPTFGKLSINRAFICADGASQLQIVTGRILDETFTAGVTSVGVVDKNLNGGNGLINNINNVWRSYGWANGTADIQPFVDCTKSYLLETREHNELQLQGINCALNAGDFLFCSGVCDVTGVFTSAIEFFEFE